VDAAAVLKKNKKNKQKGYFSSSHERSDEVKQGRNVGRNARVSWIY
jgi:hypothetical protein